MTIPPSRGQGNTNEVAGVADSDISENMPPVPAGEESQGVSDLSALTVIETMHRVAMESLVPESPGQESAVRFFVSAPGSHPVSAPIGFINQANTTLLECRGEAVQLFSFCGSSVDVVYNSQYFGWGSRHISSESETVRLLRLSWDAYFNGSTEPRSLRLQFCAGDGAYIVRAALQGYRYARRIFVVAMAPSCAIDPRLCFRVRHYRATGDITSMCSGRGSSSPDFSVVPRDPNSRGTFDFSFFSSTFLNFLYLEGLIFSVGETLLSRDRLNWDYDGQGQHLRDRCLQHPRIIRLSRRQDQTIFIKIHLGRGVAQEPINVYEADLDEFPRDVGERIGAILNGLREVWLIFSELMVFTVRGQVLSVNALTGVPFLQTAALFRQSGVYWVRRELNRANTFRLLSLRGYFVDVVQCLYNLGILSQVVLSEDLPLAVRRGLGVYMGVASVIFLTENLIRFYSPLRGRIQGWLTEVDSSSIETEATQNAEARRVGIIERLFRGVSEGTRGIAVCIAAVAVLYPVLVFRGSVGLNGHLPGNTTSLGSISTTPEDTFQGFWGGTSGFFVGLTSMISVTSIFYNIWQVIRMRQRLRRQRQMPEQTEEEESMIELIDFPPTGGIPPENEQQGFLDDLEETDTDV